MVESAKEAQNRTVAVGWDTSSSRPSVLVLELRPMRRCLTILLIASASFFSSAAFSQNASPASSPQEHVRPGPGVVPPKVLKTTEPKYTHEAEVAKSLDHTLDEAAVKTVKRWRFLSSKKNDKPVAVMVSVQLSWNLIDAAYPLFPDRIGLWGSPNITT
jgi:hypothetical protein